MKLQRLGQVQTSDSNSYDGTGLKQTLGLLIDDESEHMCLVLDRPKMHVKSVSRLPEGEYNYKVINQTPNNSLAHIVIEVPEGQNRYLRVEPDYRDNENGILVGGNYVQVPTHLNIEDQRRHLRKICGNSKDRGKITIENLPFYIP